MYLLTIWTLSNFKTFFISFSFHKGYQSGIPKNSNISSYSDVNCQIRQFDEILHLPLCSPKGRLISKCPYEITVSSKIPTKLFLDFCLEFFCSFLGASWKLFGLPGDLVCNIITRKPTGSPKELQRSPQEGTKKFRAEIQK